MNLESSTPVLSACRPPSTAQSSMFLQDIISNHTAAPTGAHAALEFCPTSSFRAPTMARFRQEEDAEDDVQEDTAQEEMTEEDFKNEIASFWSTLSEAAYSDPSTLEGCQAALEEREEFAASLWFEVDPDGEDYVDQVSQFWDTTDELFANVGDANDGDANDGDANDGDDAPDQAAGEQGRLMDPFEQAMRSRRSKKIFSFGNKISFGAFKKNLSVKNIRGLGRREKNRMRRKNRRDLKKMTPEKRTETLKEQREEAAKKATEALKQRCSVAGFSDSGDCPKMECKLVAAASAPVVARKIVTKK
jgi:hypothetical protein